MTDREILVKLSADDGRVGEVFRAVPGGAVFFHVKARNGEILDQSEGYTGHSAAQDAEATLREVMGLTNV